MLTFLYLTIAIFFIVLTFTTMASFYAGLKFWGIALDDKPVEKETETTEMMEAKFYWDNCVSVEEKDRFFQELEYNGHELPF